MDIEANLKEQRRLAAAIITLTNVEPGVDSDADDRVADQLEDKATRLAELVQAMDEWLSRGGVRPAAWQNTRDKEMTSFLRDTICHEGRCRDCGGQDPDCNAYGCIAAGILNS